MRTIAAVLALLLLSAPAQALGMCGKRDDFVSTLKSRYGETSQGKGLAGEFAVIELFTSADSFTVLATDPMGKSCIIAAGRDWIDAVPKIPGDDT